MEAALQITATVSDEDLREARLGFHRLLRAKRFHPRFIEEHADDLLGQAHHEYANWLAAGRVANSPTGWLINCAWRRTQDLLDRESHRPQSVSIEAVVQLADASAPTPEQVVIDNDRDERLRHAMGFIKPKERQLLNLVYFHGLNVIEAGESLGWSKSSADRHHKAALARLRSMLDGKIEVPEYEIGMAAWIALIGGGTAGARRATIEGALDPLRDGALAGVHRLGDLWRRVSPVSEPANATAAGSAARATGACGAAVLACLASGVIGPGVGGVEAMDHQPKAPKVSVDAHSLVRSMPVPAPQASVEPSPTPTTSRPTQTARSSRASADRPLAARRATEPTATTKTSTTEETPAQQTTTEFGLESSPAPAEESSQPSPSSSAGSSGSSSSSADVSARAATPTQPSNSGNSSPEFGL